MELSLETMYSIYAGILASLILCKSYALNSTLKYYLFLSLTSVIEQKLNSFLPIDYTFWHLSVSIGMSSSFI